MRIAIAATACWLLLGGPALGQDCRLEMYQSFAITDLADGHIQITIPIAGRPEPMAVDTAGFMSTLTKKTAADLGLTPHSAGVVLAYGMGGEKFNQVVDVPSIQVGILKLTNGHFLVDPSDSTDGTAGLLGPDILSEFDADFDFFGAKLNLFSQEHCEGNVVYWTKQPVVRLPFTRDPSGAIVIDIAIDGKPAKAILDTGAVGTLLPEAMAAHLFDIDAKSPGVEPVTGRDGKARTDMFVYQFHSLAIGGVQIGNPRLLVFQDKMRRQALQDAIDSNTGDRLDLTSATNVILGLGLLRKLHIYIAYKEKALYISAANTH